MIVSFVGAPCSGKTTTAAKLFAALKDHGHPAEFVTERARWYIAKRRVEDTNVSLTDVDQFNIMADQLGHEKIMIQACGPSVTVVTDSSALNALLYMTAAYRKRPTTQSLIRQSTTNHYDLVFLCQPVKTLELHDPNRVHTLNQSRKIHNNLKRIFKIHAPNLKLVSLVGDSDTRFKRAYRIVKDQLHAADHR